MSSDTTEKQQIPLNQRMLSSIRKTLFRTFRAALRGDEEAVYALFWWAKNSIERGEIPSKGINRYFIRILEDPILLAVATKKRKRPRKRGRPSIDDQSSRGLIPPGFKMKRAKKISPSERNAQAIAYLMSKGFLINEEGAEKKSAVQYLSILTGRSCRSLQTDYYKHREGLGNNPAHLEWGEIWLKRLETLQKYKKK